MNKYDIDDEKEIALDDKDFILEVDDFELPVAGAFLILSCLVFCTAMRPSVAMWRPRS